MNLPAADSPVIRHPRRVEGIVAGQATSDGAGVRLVRLLGAELQRRLDPWLMVDAFSSDRPDDYLAGFPSHPHRGFETVTVMHAGRMRHRDSAGHEGLLRGGDVQWMIAGRGLVHSEMPEQEDGLMAGYQLWLNLPAADKLRAPAWRDIPAAAIPQVRTAAGVQVRVIAGASHGVEGAVQRPHTAPLLLDLSLPAGSRFAQPLPAAHHGFVIVRRGQPVIGSRTVTAGRLALLAQEADSDGVVLNAGQEDVEALLVAGRPLGEPIVQHGPFVMNTRAEILAAFEDYARGSFDTVSPQPFD